MVFEVLFSMLILHMRTGTNTAHWSNVLLWNVRPTILIIIKGSHLSGQKFNEPKRVPSLQIIRNNDVTWEPKRQEPSTLLHRKPNQKELPLNNMDFLQLIESPWILSSFEIQATQLLINSNTDLKLSEIILVNDLHAMLKSTLYTVRKGPQL